MRWDEKTKPVLLFLDKIINYSYANFMQKQCQMCCKVNLYNWTISPTSNILCISEILFTFFEWDKNFRQVIFWYKEKDGYNLFRLSGVAFHLLIFYLKLFLHLNAWNQFSVICIFFQWMAGHRVIWLIICHIYVF